jgi:glutathione peroxidase
MKLLEKLKFSHSSNSSNKNKQLNRSSVHSVVINGLDGRPIFLEKYKGKHILFVNVASQCGFTNQYQDLQKVYEKYQS